MHTVERSPEPEFLSHLRDRYVGWEDLEIEERRRVRAELAHDFNRICGYCEQSCAPTTPGQADNEESVDHFRPRHRFPGEWLDWLNLVYACRRCNQAKGSKWPVIGDDDNLRLSRINRYREVSGYVCPNSVDSQPPAETFITFDVNNGEIGPADDLEDVNWSMAYRTVVDFDLNSIRPGQDNLPSLRKLRQGLLEETLWQVLEPELQQVIVAGFIQRNRPFSSFMSAYAKAIGFNA